MARTECTISTLVAGGLNSRRNKQSRQTMIGELSVPALLSSTQDITYLAWNSLTVGGQISSTSVPSNEKSNFLQPLSQNVFQLIRVNFVYV